MNYLFRLYYFWDPFDDLSFLYVFVGKSREFATADFRESLGAMTVKKEAITGILQRDGTYIFYVDVDEEMCRNLIQTTNQGSIVKMGRLKLPASSWEAPDQWLPSNRKFEIVHFQVMRGMKYYQ